MSVCPTSWSRLNNCLTKLLSVVSDDHKFLSALAYWTERVLCWSPPWNENSRVASSEARQLVKLQPPWGGYRVTVDQPKRPSDAEEVAPCTGTCLLGMGRRPLEIVSASGRVRWDSFELRKWSTEEGSSSKSPCSSLTFHLTNFRNGLVSLKAASIFISGVSKLD